MHEMGGEGMSPENSLFATSIIGLTSATWLAFVWFWNGWDLSSLFLSPVFVLLLSPLITSVILLISGCFD